MAKKILAELPVAFLAYDLLEADAEDVRAWPRWRRRERLEQIVAGAASPLRISPLVDAPDWPALAALREESRSRGVEGFMLKQREGRYGAGRTKDVGTWWKWKIDPYSVGQTTTEKFGPVRSVTPMLVVELGFEGIQASQRHKSGTAVRRWIAARGWKAFAFRREVWRAMKEGRSGLLHANTGTGRSRRTPRARCATR